jgi:glycosyltransferase involved in cell wall biosynthesis
MTINARLGDGFVTIKKAMVTAVVLTHNNEARIEDTLKGLSWCSEIIVVDDESEDKTKEIASKAGATVLTHSLHGNFAAQRNIGLEAATNEWVLFVDSDECVSPKLAHEIQKVASTSKEVGYYLKRQDYLYGKPLKFGETASVQLLRLGKKGSGMWIRPVHEVWNIPGEHPVLPVPLDHYPHPNITEFLDDINFYSTMNAKEFIRTNRRVTWFEIIFFPLGKFIQNYIIRLGFRDKMPGLLMALFMSFHSFLTRGKVYVYRQNLSKNHL